MTSDLDANQGTFSTFISVAPPKSGETHLSIDSNSWSIFGLQFGLTRISESDGSSFCSNSSRISGLGREKWSQV